MLPSLLPVSLPREMTIKGVIIFLSLQSAQHRENTTVEAGVSVPAPESLDSMGPLSSKEGKIWFLCPERSQLSLEQ